jgi:succinate dehydrogenase/fumarate reductase flavoprotein subunit
MSKKTEGISRRNFIKGAAVSAAAGVLAGCAPKVAAPATPEAAATTSTKHYWEVPPEPITDFAKTVDTEIVVVGAGISGLHAADAAAREGAKVIVLEKSTSYTYHGMDNGAIGTKWQKEEGIEIDRTEVLKYKSQWDHHKLNQDLFKVWLYRSGEVFDEIIDMVRAAGGTVSQGLGVTPGRDKLEVYYRQYRTPHTFQVGEAGDPSDISANQKGYLGFIAKDAADHGATFYYETAAKQLVTDDSKAVKGVIAQAKDGTYIKFNTSKGVILATGDINGNPEMVEAFSPMPTHGMGKGSGVINAYTPVGCNTGDHIAMGMWAGAVPQVAPPAPMVHGFGSFAIPFSSTVVGWLQVNRDGKRYNAEEPNEVSNANSMMMQPAGIGWAIWDGAYADKVLKMIPSNSGFFGAELINADTPKIVEAALASDPPAIYKGDTLEELAEKIGVPADALKATVTRYNELCAKGVDDDFGKRELWMSGTSVDTAPYYASKMSGMWFVTIYGLHCNEFSQVLDADDKPIANLFAVGNAQGDFFTDDYPLLTPGISHGRATVFGRLVGKALAKGELY